MTRPLLVAKHLTYFAFLAVLAVVFPSFGQAGTWVPFGPQTYVRGAGSPAPVTNTFSLLNPTTQYTLHIVNGGLGDTTTELASGSVITINGVQVVGPNNFNKNVTVLDVPLTLQFSNTISVEVRGKPGGAISVEIIGVDNDPPIISASLSPSPNSAGWNNSSVTVSFSCSDKTSGVAFCPSPVSLTTEGANQIISGTVKDLAGNTATASVTVNLDMTPPVISGAISPAPDAAGWNSSAVTVNFLCSDALSGMASCSSPVALTTEGGGQVVTGTATDVAGNTATINVTVNISFKFFSIRNYAGKCLDYGASPSGNGATVFLNDCAQAHSIRVEEINISHDVVLHAGSQVIGIYNPPVNTLGLAPFQPPYVLELQTYNPILTTTANQIFTLDGDSIILANSRFCIHSTDANGNTTYVNRADGSTCPSPLPPQIAVQIPGSGANGSGLIAGQRNLADSEFWDFNAVDGSDKDPTSGFVRVATREELLGAYFQINQIAQQNNGAAWGSVIKIIGSPICLTPNPDTLVIPTGMTVRGDRRGSNLGPLLLGLYQPASSDFPAPRMFDVEGDFVRITGLRLQGPTRATDATINPTDAIEINASISPHSFAGTLIDHNDLSDWNNAAVEVFGVPVETKGGPDTVTCPVPDSSRNDHIRIERNFIHHNEEPLGYAIAFSIGGAATISKNTFSMNRHSIAGDGDVREQYSAWFNLSLSQQPRYGFFHTVNQTFDMHGAFGGYGGYAGGPVEIAWNTFLPSDGDVFWLRGQPCNLVNGVTNAFSDSFHNNVSLRNHDEAIRVYDVGGNHDYPTSSTSSLTIENNQFADSSPSYSDPTDHLGVGDFDGDGIQDLFLATGAAWYYSPAGKAEWRYLNGGKTDKIDSLLLGDFDGDGRTDAVGINPSGQLAISWGSVSDWVVFNANFRPCASISDMAVADFDGDGKADIFCADGASWYVSSGGSGLFNFVNTSSFRVHDLRFGHFSICGSGGEADVFGIVAGKWQVSCGATSAWTPLPVSLTDHIDGLVVADFQGNGLSDIATNSLNDWMIWYSDKSDWVHYQINDTDRCISPQPSLSLMPGIGNFDGLPGADVLLWDGGNEFCIASGGNTGLQIWSRQDMR
jgi:hypothetical protein